MAEFNLTQMQFVATRMIQEKQLADMSGATIESFYRMATEDLVFAMKLHIWGRERDRRVVRWPADWWEALKLRFAPYWFTVRYPVRWHTTIITRHDLYPGMVLHGIKAVPFFDIKEGTDE